MTIEKWMALGPSGLGRMLAVLLVVCGLSGCGGSGDADTGAGHATGAKATARASVAADMAQKSSKRGVAYGQHSAADLAALAPGLAWWANWSPKPEAAVAGSYAADGVEFVPMAWGGNPTQADLLAAIPADARYLIGFNEPNFKSQANMVPSRAAALWPVLQAVATQRGLKLGAPSVNYCGGNDCVSEGGVTFTDPIAYLDAFMADCQGCQIDFIPVHWYACDVSALQSYVARFKKYQKPIWVTEFACGDMQPQSAITLDVQKKYMTDAVAYLENEPAVARYAWFSGRSTQIPNVNLLGADGQLTELGRLYTSLPYLGNQAESEVVPVSAFASSQERGDLNAAAAIDNNLSTRWGSAFTDSEYLALDFGKSVTVTRLAINWENAHADSYQIQTSDDRNTWTTIRTVTGSTGGVENLTGLSGNGRYIRMLGLKRATQYGYSIYEIHAFTNSPPPTPVPTPVPTPTPNPVPVTAPGAVITPVAATSSAVENPSLSASNAIDGNLSTRWSSAFVDNAWLQIDLGVSQDIGYLKLVWENSYAKEYVIETSDDGQSWTVVRHVYNGNGGTEELFNLRAHGRYIRMQGIQRATQYGYSLWEVVVMSPGTDNTAPTYTPVALKTPQANEAPVSLYQPGDPVETLQFSLPDGTLITRFGNRAQNRHSRERGEQWNEIGYGPNETVDPVTGQPVDKGPGDFLNFVAHYFQYRTWGLEIVDNSNVPGVTKPTLQFHLYNNSIEFHNDTIAYFRRYDSPYVTGYGWMNGSSFATDLSNPFNTDTCAPVAFPVGKALGSPICSTLVTEYPGHAALDGNGFPIPGVNVPARPLVVGDFVEVSPSYFVNQAALTAKGDVGNARYYSGEWMYVVGKGITPWYGIQPRLNSVPLPADTLSGGTTSVSYNYSNNGNRMFEQAATNTGMQNMQRFVEGRRLVHTDFFTGKHTETVNEDYTPARGLAGPFYSKALCMACHTNNGRSDAIVNLNQRLDNMNVKTGVIGADGKVTAHPIYGETVQMNALSSSGNVQDWGNSVKVVGFDTRTLTLNDGTQVQLRKPQIGFDGPVPALYSLRSAPPMIGAGLLEAIPEADIIARARTTPDADGVQGVANYVYDPETGAPRLGRFGWKASRVSIRHQVASAFIHDMSVTTPVYPKKSCHADVADCRTGVGQPGVTEADLQKVVNYVSLLAVPAQRSLQSGFPKGVAPLPEHIVNPIQVASGRNTFAAINCVACHIAQMKTGSTHPFEELRNQTIHPYTDMLLHDMGDGLADNLPEGKASGRQWRTPALWGIGYTPWVQGGDQNVGYLHDGRARTLLEAIEWHGGEALKSRQRFENLSTADREAVLAFLRSL